MSEPLSVNVSVWFTTDLRDQNDYRTVLLLSKTEKVLLKLQQLDSVTSARVVETSDSMHYDRGSFKRKLTIELMVSPEVVDHQRSGD